MNNVPESVWMHTPITDSVKILFECDQIKKGLTQSHNMLITKKLQSKNSATIHIPSLKCLFESSFWDSIPKKYYSKVNDNLDSTVKKLADNLEYDDFNFSILKKEYEEKASLIWSLFLEYMPKLFKGIKRVEVYPTPYGSISSEYSSFLVDSSIVKIFIRKDASLANLFEMIISERIKRLSLFKGDWMIKEGVVDFILLETKLADIFTGYIPTIDGIKNNQNGKLAIESIKYFKQIGYPIKSVLKIYGDNIYAGENVIKIRSYQYSILKLLIENRNKIVTYDEIADVIWGKFSDEKFSLYAITKLVERIRTRLKEEGINKDIIYTIKGKGFALCE